MVSVTSGVEAPRSPSGAPWVFRNPDLSNTLFGFSTASYYYPMDFGYNLLGTTYDAIVVLPEYLHFGLVSQSDGDEGYPTDTAAEAMNSASDENWPALNLQEDVNLNAEKIYISTTASYTQIVIVWGDLGDPHKGTDETVEVVFYNDGAANWPVEIRTGSNIDDLLAIDSWLTDTSTSTTFDLGSPDSVVITHDGSSFTTNTDHHVTGDTIPDWPNGQINIGGRDDQLGRVFTYPDSRAQSEGADRRLRISTPTSNTSVIPTQSTGTSDTSNTRIQVPTDGTKEISEFLTYSSETHALPRHWSFQGDTVVNSRNVGAVEDFHTFTVDNGDTWSVDYLVFTDGNGNVQSLDGITHLRTAYSFNNLPDGQYGWYFHIRDDAGNWTEQVDHQEWPANQEPQQFTANISATNVTGIAITPDNFAGDVNGDADWTWFHNHSPNYGSEWDYFGATADITLDVGY